MRLNSGSLFSRDLKLLLAPRFEEIEMCGVPTRGLESLRALIDGVLLIVGLGLPSTFPFRIISEGAQDRFSSRPAPTSPPFLSWRLLFPSVPSLLTARGVFFFFMPIADASRSGDGPDVFEEGSSTHSPFAGKVSGPSESLGRVVCVSVVFALLRAAERDQGSIPCRALSRIDGAARWGKEECDGRRL